MGYPSSSTPEIPPITRRLSEKDILVFGRISIKREWHNLGIEQKDRATHFYIIGATGTGKTKFIENLVYQDIYNKEGFAVIDPTGDLIKSIKENIFWTCGGREKIEKVKEKVIIFDPKNKDYSVVFNPLEKTSYSSAAEQAKELVSAFRKIWKDSWGARMEDLLRNSLVALIEAELTLLELPLLLTNKTFRENVLKKTTNPITKLYFQRFEDLSDKTKNEWMESTLNKIDAFLIDDEIRDIFSLPKNSFNIREIMDQGKILLINLDKGRLKDSGFLIGSLFLSKIWMSTLSRTDLDIQERRPFYLYIDEFQNFATDDFIEGLSEARKFGLSLIMAHQTLSQIPPQLQQAILGNCGIQVYFRVSREDAEELAKEIFQTTGTRVKAIQISKDSLKEDFYTYSEEWERYFQELQALTNQFFYIKNKSKGEYRLFQSIQISDYTLDPGFSRAFPNLEVYWDQIEYFLFNEEIYFSRKTIRQLSLEREEIKPEDFKESI